ncbi:MAG: hypothetical protein VXW25_08885 [Pseudomonadota bacterium]|nr:hypothetical protein [Pseudomonadota bacterium]
MPNSSDGLLRRACEMAAAKALFGFAAGAAGAVGAVFPEDDFAWRRDAAGGVEATAGVAGASPSTAMKLAAWPLPA